MKSKKYFILFLLSILVINSSYRNVYSNKASVVVPVLMYHDIDVNYKKDPLGAIISPQNLKAQLLCLKKNGYVAISFKQLDNYLNNHGSLPKKPILITFDDGYSSNYKYGFKILKKLHMKAEINLITSTIHNNNKNNKFLSVNQIKEMYKSKLIEFGSHTYAMHSKKLLSKGKTENQKTYYKRIYRDFKESYEILHKLLNKPSNILALPYGFYNSTIINAAKKARFNNILTIENGSIKKGSNLLKIPRVYASGYSSPKELLKKIIYQSNL